MPFEAAREWCRSTHGWARAPKRLVVAMGDRVEQNV